MEIKTNLYSITLQELANDILVECPNCKSKAVVKKPNNNNDSSHIKLTCFNCGYNKILEELPHAIDFASNGIIPDYVFCFGTEIDPYFHLPLWLKTSVGKHILWAYNYNHLNLLENHISKQIRERNGLENRNKSVASRLPKWITSKKNRDTLLKSIDRLNKK